MALQRGLWSSIDVTRIGRRAVALSVAALALGSAVTACDSSSSAKKASSPSTSGSSSGPSTSSPPTVTDPVFARTASFSGPIAGTPAEPRTAVSVDLAPNYVEQEFFAAGTASAFTGTDPRNGRWTITPTTKAAYKTRIIVRRPASASRFNGTVVVEWLNETSGESSPDWTFLSSLLIAKGYAYVAVSTQATAVGGVGASSAAGTGLAQTVPKRYGTLNHPGDKYAFDLFGQIARGLRAEPNSAVLGGLRPKYIVATGESQSAAYLVTFANAFQPEDRAFDGIFIHSRGSGTAPLDGGPAASGGSPNGQLIRTDQTEPVFQFQTETDASLLGFAKARQPDTDRIRTWEVAGTAHVDRFLVGPVADSLGCNPPINDGPQHVVIQAAFTAFTDWVRSGKAPPTAKALEFSSAGSGTLARDGNGNALGGVRTPAVDVPYAALRGEPSTNTGNGACVLLGSTTAYPASKLVRLYGSRSGYLAKYEKSLDAAINGGFILATARAELLNKAQAVHFP